MNKTDSELMAEYGITSKTRTMYSYKQHNYERLKDALSYAEIDTDRHQQNGKSIASVEGVDSNKRNDD